MTPSSDTFSLITSFPISFSFLRGLDWHELTSDVGPKPLHESRSSGTDHRREAASFTLTLRALRSVRGWSSGPARGGPGRAGSGRPRGRGASPWPVAAGGAAGG